MNQSIYTPDQAELVREVKFLHQQFFRCEASHSFVDNYIRAHLELQDLKDGNNSELRTMRIIIDNELDAFGIEPWLRSKSRRHLLSRKLLLLAYIGECDAARLKFRSEVKGRWRCFAQLFRSSILAGIYLVRGRLQKALHGLL